MIARMKKKSECYDTLHPFVIPHPLRDHSHYHYLYYSFRIYYVNKLVCHRFVFYE